MQTQDTFTQLTDLPVVFKPGDPTYVAVINAILAGLNVNGASTEALNKQLSFQTATGNWLSLWGLLIGVPRSFGESDAQYRLRVINTITGWASTPAGIGAFIENTFGLNVSIVENFLSPSYSIRFAVPATAAIYNEIAQGLSHIRPAGIPIAAFNVVTGGGFLQTNQFLGMADATGAYLESATANFTPALNGNTNNINSNIPGSYLDFPNNFSS